MYTRAVAITLALAAGVSGQTEVVTVSGSPVLSSGEAFQFQYTATQTGYITSIQMVATMDTAIGGVYWNDFAISFRNMNTQCEV